MKTKEYLELQIDNEQTELTTESTTDDNEWLYELISEIRM